jgi:hypothetical protein
MFNSEVLDDPLLTDEVTSFAGGMVSLVKPQNLAPDQWADLENIDIDRSGRGKSRVGTTALGSTPSANPMRGLFFFEGTTDYLAGVSNGVFRTWDGAAWATVAGFTPSAGSNVEFAQLIDTLYMSAGAGIFSWTGSGAAAAVGGSPSARFIVSHTNRLFAAGYNGGAGTETDKLAASDILTPGTWGAGFSMRVGGGDGEGITGIASWHNYLLAVFKRNATYVVDADPTAASASEWAVSTIHSRIGCVAHRTIQPVGTDLFFLADDGVRTLRRTINEQQIGVEHPLSNPIQPLIDRINWSSVSTACSAYVNNRYLLAVPLDSATTPDHVLVYNTLTGSWSGYWTGWNPLVFALTRFSGTKKLVFGQNNGSVWEFKDWNASPSASDYTDNGAAYETVAVSRGMSFGDIKPPKTGYSYEAEFYGSHAQAMVVICRDNSGAHENSYFGRTRGDLLTLPFDLPALLPVSGSYLIAGDLMNHGQFRSIQLKFISSTGKMAIQRLATYAFMDTIEEERNFTTA